MKRLTQNEFIERATKIHGGRYDYSLVEYKNNRTKVGIICSLHGVFYQTPDSHLQGCGCRKCGLGKLKAKALETSINKNKKAANDFVKKAKKIHDDKYDYSSTKYTHSLKKVKIICKKHGVFFQTPCSHLRGRGCKECAHEALLSGEDKFIEKAKKIHGNFYDYSLVEYKNNRTKVEIICPIHGVFKQKPNDHLNGSGCRKCGSIACGEKQKEKVKAQFIKRAVKIHGDKYDYSKVSYNGVRNKITIICPIHGEFKQTAMNHLVGYGCHACANRGFDLLKPGILYYIKINAGYDKPLYKIGITNNSVDKRYSLVKDREKIELVKIWKFNKGIEAFKIEKSIKKKYSEFLFNGIPPLSSVGVSEIFSKDVLGLAA